MRATLSFALALLLGGAGAASAEKLPEEFRFEFQKTYRAKFSYAVVAQGGIPTTSVYGVDGKQTDAHYAVDVVDGRWKTSEGLLDFNQVAADTLALGEVMELVSLSFKDNRIDMRLVSLEAKKVSRGSGFSKSEKREPVATYFKFFFPVPKSKVMTAADVPMALDYVGRYLQAFPDEASARARAARLVAEGGAGAGLAARGPAPVAASAGATSKKEIKVGMTPLEVIDILGRPQKELTFGTASRWNYPDLTVIFESGRVKEVRF